MRLLYTLQEKKLRLRWSVIYRVVASVIKKENNMLTLQALKDMKPHTVIATGLTIDNPTGVNMTNSDKRLR